MRCWVFLKGNTVERLFILTAGDEITEHDVGRMLAPTRADGGLGDGLLAAESYDAFKESAERALPSIV